MLGVNQRAPFRWMDALEVAVIYSALVLAFTGLGMAFAPPSAQVGGTRALDTIPPHLIVLSGFGLLLGLGCALIYGRRGAPLVLLMPVLTVGLDLDHLPVYLGYAETIRPAHSVFFLAAALAATAITVKALDVDLIVMSAFMGHMAVDTGLFAPLSPLSFDYFQLDQYRPVFAAIAVLCAVGAGAVMRRHGTPSVPGGVRVA